MLEIFMVVAALALFGLCGAVTSGLEALRKRGRG